MALPQAIDIRISMLRLAPQCFAFTSYNIQYEIVNGNGNGTRSNIYSSTHVTWP